MWTAPLSAAVRDLNSDGTLDLAAANGSCNSVSILLGTGTGNFGAATNFAVGANPGFVYLRRFRVGTKCRHSARRHHVAIAQELLVGEVEPKRSKLRSRSRSIVAAAPAFSLVF
jgi:hypothetical protein